MTIKVSKELRYAPDNFVAGARYEYVSTISNTGPDEVTVEAEDLFANSPFDLTTIEWTETGASTNTGVGAYAETVTIPAGEALTVLIVAFVDAALDFDSPLYGGTFTNQMRVVALECVEEVDTGDSVTLELPESTSDIAGESSIPIIGGFGPTSSTGILAPLLTGGSVTLNQANAPLGLDETESWAVRFGAPDCAVQTDTVTITYGYSVTVNSLLPADGQVQLAGIVALNDNGGLTPIPAVFDTDQQRGMWLPSEIGPGNGRSYVSTATVLVSDLADIVVAFGAETLSSDSRPGFPDVAIDATLSDLFLRIEGLDQSACPACTAHAETCEVSVASADTVCWGAPKHDPSCLDDVRGVGELFSSALSEVGTPESLLDHLNSGGEPCEWLCGEKVVVPELTDARLVDFKQADPPSDISDDLVVSPLGLRDITSFHQGDFQTALGETAGDGNTGLGQVAVGFLAGQNNTGETQVAIGVEAGIDNTGDTQAAVGQEAGKDNTGTRQVAFGREAGKNNAGDNQVAIGREAGVDNAGLNQIAIGWDAGGANTGDHTLALGHNAGVGNAIANATMISKEILPAFADRPTAEAALPLDANYYHLYIDLSDGTIKARI